MARDQRAVGISTLVLFVGLLASPATVWRPLFWHSAAAHNKTTGLLPEPQEIACLLADPPPRLILAPIVSCPAAGGLG